jgi:hypothetical protein
MSEIDAQNPYDGTRQKRFCPVGGKSSLFSHAKDKWITRQNSAENQQETSGVVAESGPGRGVPGSFYCITRPLRGMALST